MKIDDRRSLSETKDVLQTCPQRAVGCVLRIKFKTRLSLKVREASLPGTV